MGDVIDIFSKKSENISFLCCSCCPEDPQPYIPIVDVSGSVPVIIALICPECETEHIVSSGKVYQSEGEAQ